MISWAEKGKRLRFLRSLGQASGQGEIADAASEHIGAIAMDDGVADDVIAVQVVIAESAASDA